jgi:hypothetical protein
MVLSPSGKVTCRSLQRSDEPAEINRRVQLRSTGWVRPATTAQGQYGRGRLIMCESSSSPALLTTPPEPRSLMLTWRGSARHGAARRGRAGPGRAWFGPARQCAAWVGRRQRRPQTLLPIQNLKHAHRKTQPIRETPQWSPDRIGAGWFLHRVSGAQQRRRVISARHYTSMMGKIHITPPAFPAAPTSGSSASAAASPTRSAAGRRAGAGCPGPELG